MSESVNKVQKSSLFRRCSNSSKLIRNLIAFWFFGLANNFGYVVMLSAAFDIMKRFDEDNLNTTQIAEVNFKRECNTLSTGTILLASIIPSSLAKAVASFLPMCINFRMALIVGTSILGLLLAGLCMNKFCLITGVCFVSFSSGLGENSLLSYTVFFTTKNVISTWSSGTGAAGLLGSFAYSILLEVGLSPQTAIITVVIMPIIMGICFWIVMVRPDIGKSKENTEESQADKIKLTFKEKIVLIPKIILVYTLPYGLVYFFEYFINQGLFELLYFPKEFLSHKQQYRWYNSIYQIGVFVARSTVNIVRVNNLWVLAFLQFTNMILFIFEAMFGYMAYLPIAMVLILWEGLVGGATYVNTFRRIADEASEKTKEFTMGINTNGDSLMITLAGILAIPVHDVICNMSEPYVG